MLDLMMVVLIAFVLYFFTVIRSTGLLNANSLFVYVQTVLALGTFRLLDTRVEADYVHGILVAWAILSYLTVSTVVMLTNPPLLRKKGKWTPPLAPVRALRPTATTWIVLAFCILIVIIYYRGVGSSALIEGVRNTLTGGDADIAGIRLSAYAGDQYLAPGYVNQFKNALLPALVAVFITYWVQMGQKRPLLTAFLVGFTIFGLVGTGQRGAFIHVSAAVAVYLYLLAGNRFNRSTLLIGFGAVGVLLVATLALGRGSTESGPGASFIDQITLAGTDLISRFLEQQQNGGITAFRYVYEQPIQWGGEWWAAFTGLLPGAGGTDLPSRVFETVYGSTRGTISPSIWGSVYHNFGWFGIIVIPGLMAFVIGMVARLGGLDRPRNTLELFGIAGVAATLGLWAAGTPVTPLNNGFAMYVLIWTVGSHLRIPPQRSQPEHLCDPSGQESPITEVGLHATPWPGQPGPMRG